MKYILLLLLLPLSGFAQNNVSQLIFERKVKVEDASAKNIYKDAMAMALKKANLFYTANKEAERNCPMITRSSMGENSKEPLLGYVKRRSAKGDVVAANGLCVYEIPEGDGCVQILAVSYEVMIRCMKGAADVQINNLKYYHFRRNKPATMVPIGAGGKELDLKGRYEDLVKSGTCADELKDIDVFVRNAINKILDRIGAEIGGNTKAVDW